MDRLDPLILSQSSNQNHPLHTQRCSCRFCIFSSSFCNCISCFIISYVSTNASSHFFTLSLSFALSSSFTLSLSFGTSVSITWASADFCFSVSSVKVKACKSCDTSCIGSCNVFFISFANRLKSRRGHCSLALAFLPSQSSLDQSNGVVRGCGTSYLQYVHSPCVLVYSHLGVGLIKSTFLKSIVCPSCML